MEHCRKQINLSPYVFHYFEAPYELARAVETKERTILTSPSYTGFLTDSSFIGRSFSTFAEVRQASESYWKEGWDVFCELKKLLEKVEFPQPKSLKRELIWSEEDGFELDLDRLQRDRPYWRSSRRHHRPGPINITIVSNITCHGGIEPMDVLWRGAAMIVLTEILEQAGYRVEMLLAHHSSGAFYDGTLRKLTVMRLKRPQEPIDVMPFVNAVSAWFYRTILFGSYWLDGAPTHGHGQPCDLNPIKSHITHDQQVILCENVWSQAAAVAWIKSEINKLK